MEKYGPLYHRNGEKLWPKALARLVIGIALLVLVGEVAMIIVSAVQ